jgi:hypothetical protein
MKDMWIDAFSSSAWSDPPCFQFALQLSVNSGFSDGLIDALQRILREGRSHWWHLESSDRAFKLLKISYAMPELHL